MDIHTEHIIAYLEGRLSKEEKEAFDQHLQSSSNFKKEVDDIRFIWETTAELKLHKQINTQQNWKKISKQIAADKYKKKALSFIRTVAAVLLIPVLIATYTLYDTLKEWNNIPVEQVELSTTYGLISKVTLPDGSEVWLNSGSSISYPKRFTKNKRSVQLTGEAYFKVTSDKSNRFDVVTSNGLQVSAYGTEFNVKAYEEENSIEVTLTEGKVGVRLENQMNVLQLTPGQQISYDKVNKRISKRDVNLNYYTSWREGKYYFNSMTFENIARQLERSFNVDIHIASDELKNIIITGDFIRGENLEQIMRVMTADKRMKYMIDGDQVYIYEK